MSAERQLDVYTILSYFLLSNDRSLPNALLDGWTNEVVLKGEYDFDDGITGLGWLFAFLIQKGILDGDIDAILLDVDDNVYKITLKEVVGNQIDIGRLLELSTFYGQRLANRKSTAHFYRSFTHSECMKLVLEKLNVYLLTMPLNDGTVRVKVDILLKYSYLLKTCIVESLVEEAFYGTMEALVAHFERANTEHPFEREMLLALSKLLHCAIQYQNPCWVKKLYTVYIGVTEEMELRHSTELAIWDDFLMDGQPPRLSIGGYQDYLKTKEGQRLLFTLYTNIHEFEVAFSDMYLEKAIRKF